MKICKKCGIEKDVSVFSKHQSTKDRLYPYCRSCVSELRQIRYSQNPDLEKKRSRENWEKYKSTQKYKDKKAQYQRSFRAKNPIVYKARKEVEKALRRGDLKRQPCEVCGTTSMLQAHHDDYSKPLDVRWICFEHHREMHGRFFPKTGLYKTGSIAT